MLYSTNMVTASSLEVLKVLITIGKREEISHVLSESASWKRDTCGSNKRAFYVDLSVESYHLSPTNVQVF